MANLPFPIIDSGLVLDNESGKRYIYRSFINMALGYAWIYPETKDVGYTELEMELLAMPKQQHQMMWDATEFTDALGEKVVMPARVVPIHWDEEGLPNIPIMQLMIYMGILNKSLTLISVDEGFEEDHKALIAIFAKHLSKKDLEQNDNFK